VPSPPRAHTGQYFAFTITSPLAAAFLGAGYWAAVPIEALAARQARWANARISVPAVLTFTVLTLAVTLTHLGQLHLGARYPAGTQAVTVAWLAIYVLVPALLATFWVRQARSPAPTRPAPRACPAGYAPRWPPRPPSCSAPAPRCSPRPRRPRRPGPGT